MKIKVSIAQTQIQFGSIEKNLETTQLMIQAAALQKAQWIVFPELWLHGYDLKNFSDLSNSTPAALQEICSLAQTNQLTVWGTILENHGNQLFNTLVVLTPDGRIQFPYRKTHLFRPLGEDRWLKPGSQLAPVVNIQTIPVGPAICYDLRFPELFRAQMLAGALCTILPAEWSRPRIEHWQILLRSRAIENQSFFIGVNAVNQTGKEKFAGSSAIISPKGEILAQASLHTPALLTAEMDFDTLLEWRAKFPVLEDRRVDLY
jgi:predicted amidohydrolase